MIISTVPGPASPPGASTSGGTFYPAIDLVQMRKDLRINSTVTEDQMVAAVEGGILHVQAELAEWRAAREADGHAEMADVDAETVNDKNRLTLLYTRAVRFQASAEIWDIHRDISATADGQNRADDDELSSDEYERKATLAIRQIEGTGPSAVELI